MNEELIYCPKCGQKIVPNTTFCTNCGKNITSKQETNNTKQINYKQLSTQKFFIIGISIILLLLIISSHLSVVVDDGMAPAIYRGDIAAIYNVNNYGIQEFNPYTDISVGDIVVYNAEWYDKPVIHRVIDIQTINGTKYYTIKGDNFDIVDPYLVTPNQIISKVIKLGDQPLIIPKIGHFTLLFMGI